MTEQNHLCRVWDIIEKVSVCMLTTQFAGGLRARPIEARIDRDAGLIFFVTDVHSAKHDEIDTAPNVGRLGNTDGEHCWRGRSHARLLLRSAAIAEHAGKAAIDHSMATMFASKCPISTRSPIFLPMSVL